MHKNMGKKLARLFSYLGFVSNILKIFPSIISVDK